MDNYLMKIDGSDGQIYLYNNKITIARSGIWAMLSHGMKPQKDVILKNIISVDMQEAGFNQGSFTLNCIGETNKKDFTLKFTKKNNQNFLTLKNKIIELIDNGK